MKDHYFEKESRVRKVFKIFGMVLGGLILAVFLALVFGFVVKWLWNYLMPTLFGLQQITYWQAFAIVILAKLIFGSFGSGHHDKRYIPRRSDRILCSKSNHLEETPWSRKSNDWKYYKKFWHEEGKAAFEEFMRKTKMRGEDETNEG